MNSKQRRKEKKQQIRLVNSLIESIEKMFDDIESGKSSIKEERAAMQELKDLLINRS